MEDKIQEPEEIDELDLGKYGLSYLEGKNILALTGADMDKLLNALGNDDISLKVPIPCTPDNVDRVLAYSECRRCGKCCVPNPLNPGNPGVEVFEDELKRIAGHLHLPYETLREETLKGKNVPYPYELDKIYVTRWLPLPCPFYNGESNECRAHSVRPVVCKIHPIVFTGDSTYMAIKVNCDYGKDLVVRAFRDLRTNSPDLVLKI